MRPQSVCRARIYIQLLQHIIFYEGSVAPNLMLRLQEAVITLIKVLHRISIEAENHPHASRESTGLQIHTHTHTPLILGIMNIPGHKTIFEKLIEYGANGQTIPLRLGQCTGTRR